MEWLVLDIDPGKNRALLISKYCIDCQAYNDADTATTWATYSLRYWLNNAFLNHAFSSDEQSKIASVTLDNWDNPSYGTNGGDYTTDKVFLLSIDEATTYASESDMAADPTKYTEAQTIFGQYWWLRSPGDRADHAAWVAAHRGILGWKVTRSIGISMAYALPSG